MPDLTPGEKRVIAAIADAIQEAYPGMEDTGDALPVPDGSVLVKFAVVTDWLSPDNQRFIARTGGNSSGEGGTTWDLDGLFHEALYGLWDGGVA